MIFRIDGSYLFRSSEEKILKALLENGGELTTKELADITGLIDDTILPNCKKLIKKGLVYDKPNQKGKYRLVESAKLPTFLLFRNLNKTESERQMKELFFPSSTIRQNKLERFVNNIGMYILYVLIERINPKGPWTSDRFKEMIENDPRMKDIDLLRDTWVLDIIDHSFLIEQFDKYVNNDNQTYQELVKAFESTFSNKIFFHERIDKLRKSRKNEKKNKKQEPEIFDEELTTEEIEERDTEIYNKDIVGYEDYFERRKKNKIKSG